MWLCAGVCLDRSSGLCKPTLAKGSKQNIVVVKSNCAQAPTKTNYGSWKKGSLTSPCTNRPVECKICSSTLGAIRPFVWSYHYLDHMQLCHPLQHVTPNEIEEYSISEQELQRVLRLKDIAFTDLKAKLKSEAMSLPKTSLFWSKVLA
jgi:hypothetical protein